MKNLMILLGFVLLASACEKCADCKCNMNISNEAVYFDQTGELAVPAASRDSVIIDQEICAKGKDFETQTDAIISDTGTVAYERVKKDVTISTGTFDWGYDEYWVTTCSCDK